MIILTEKARMITLNRKAYHDYNIEETIEAGIVLTGTEIKSIRAGRVNLREAYARPEKGELWLLGAHIAQYLSGNRYNHEPKRPRKLLLHRKEINRLIEKREEKGFTLVPLRLYLKDNLAKVELGVAKGRKIYDKRQFLAQREAEREIERAIKAQRAKS
jgi:SsrA-binding protein